MTVDNLIMENNNNRENTNLNEWKIKMKKYLFPIALLCSSTCLAFPAYNTVSCSGNINGHNTYLEYNKTSHILIANIDGSRGASYANEAGNRIYTNPEYDQYGNLLVGEIVSNSTNWQAKFNLYANNQLVISGPINCQRLGLKLDSEQQTSLTEIMSQLKISK